MKTIFLSILINAAVLLNAQQIYTLRPTEADLPDNSYQKDTSNELPSYEGTWKGTWDNKTIYITFTKITYKYDNDFKYYRDYLIGKFKVLDNTGNILFDNTNVDDNNAKIQGVNFRRYGDKYSLFYSDPDLCHITGNITVNFSDPTKQKLEWKYSKSSDWTDNDCFYHGLPQSQRPNPLPNNTILTKQ